MITFLETARKIRQTQPKVFGQIFQRQVFRVMFQNVLMNLFERISSTGEEHHSFGGNIRVIPVFGESTDAAECRRQRNRKFLFQPEDQLLYAIDGRVVIYRQKDYNYIFAAKSCDSDIFTIKILVKKLGNRLKRCVFFLREKNSKMKKLGIRQKRCGSQQVLPVFIGAPFLQIAGK